MTAAVEHVPAGPRVTAWTGPPLPAALRIVPDPPPPPTPRYAGRFVDRADYERHKLRNAAAKIRQRHPRLTRDQAVVEALARQAWRASGSGGCVGNGMLLVEHVRAERLAAERAARRRRPEERNLRATVRAAVRRRDAARRPAVVDCRQVAASAPSIVEHEKPVHDRAEPGGPVRTGHTPPVDHDRRPGKITADRRNGPREAR